MTPEHYSRDVPKRCESLLRNLLPAIERGFPDTPEFGGPLKTTFLLAMATPMIVLPIERIFKPQRDGVGATSDLTLDPDLDGRVQQAFASEAAFGSAQFFTPGAWSFTDRVDKFDVARDWPASVLERLASREAFQAAEEAPARVVMLALRNALGHGGITYLGADGRNTEQGVRMLGFASVAGPNKLRLLRIHKEDFRQFLGNWAAWLAPGAVTLELPSDFTPNAGCEMV